MYNLIVLFNFKVIFIFHDQLQNILGIKTPYLIMYVGVYLNFKRIIKCT